MSGERTKRFRQAREKLRNFKQRTGMSYAEISERTGVKKSTVKWVLGTIEPGVKKDLQETIDKIIKALRINPKWVYGNDTKVMIDNQALTPIEIYHTGIDTESKRKACLERFAESREIEGVSIKQFSGIASVYPSEVSHWFRENKIPNTCIKAMLEYCKIYKINPAWLFFGKEEQNDRGHIPRKRKPKDKHWYLVNYSELHYNGWVLIPERYQIKQAYTATDVAKDYPAKRVEIKTEDGRYIDSVIHSERAIGRYTSEHAAKNALEREKRRIKKDGNNAWIAPWAKEVIR